MVSPKCAEKYLVQLLVTCTIAAKLNLQCFGSKGRWAQFWLGTLSQRAKNESCSVQPAPILEDLSCPWITRITIHLQRPLQGRDLIGHSFPGKIICLKEVPLL